MEKKLKDIKQKIVSYIKTQKISMKPRWYFVFLVLMRLLVALAIFVSVVYLSSFISLVMREHEFFKLMGIRPHGVRTFMLAVPWLLIFMSISLLLVLEVLTNKFEFVYKRPLAYSLFALVVLVLGVGFVVHKIDREFRFARFGEKPDMPLLGPIHKYYRGEFEQRPYVRGLHRQPPVSDMSEMKYLPE